MTVDIAGDNSHIAAGMSAEVMRIHEAPGSDFGALTSPFGSLMEQRSKLLRINMRDNRYWWSTRIFLVAALAEDYTDVEALVFVRSGDEQIFVGIASPRAVRARMTELFPVYAVAYRLARAGTGLKAIDCLGDVERVGFGQDASTEVCRPLDEVESMLKAPLLDPGRWQDALERLGHPEGDIRQFVGSGDIADWFRGDLDTEAFVDGPLTELRQYRIISRGLRFAALTGDRGRLEDVVDRDELAVRLSTGYLERTLSRL